MAKLPELRRLTPEDVDLETEEGQSALFTTFNYFAEQTQLALNGNLVIGDNVTGKLVTVQVRTPAGYSQSNSFSPVPLNWGKVTRASSVLVVQVSPWPAAAVQAQWNRTATTDPQLVYLTGLADSTNYTVTLLLL